jgi:hypothetical protein
LRASRRRRRHLRKVWVVGEGFDVPDHEAVVEVQRGELGAAAQRRDVAADLARGKRWGKRVRRGEGKETKRKVVAPPLWMP